MELALAKMKEAAMASGSWQKPGHLENIWQKYITGKSWSAASKEKLKAFYVTKRDELLASFAKKQELLNRTPEDDGLPSGGNLPGEEPQENTLEWFVLSIEAFLQALQEINPKRYTERWQKEWTTKCLGFENIWDADVTDKDKLKNLLEIVKNELHYCNEPVTA